MNPFNSVGILTRENHIGYQTYTTSMDRPYIHINCASTADGKIALPDGGRLRISDEWDIARVQRLRRELGSVMVGAGTVLADDPKLCLKREYSSKDHTINRIILDGGGKISPDSRFLKTPGRSIVVTSPESDPAWRDGIREAKGEVLVIDQRSDRGGVDVNRLMDHLLKIGIDGILLEGGSKTIWEFASGGLFDRFTIYYGPLFLGGCGPAISSGPGFQKEPLRLRLSTVVRTPGGGLLVGYEPR